MNNKELARKRMRLIVGRLQEYVRTYSDQAHFDTYSDTIFIDDMLYGIGIALEPLEYRTSPGFDEFKKALRAHLDGRQQVPTSGQEKP